VIVVIWLHIFRTLVSYRILFSLSTIHTVQIHRYQLETSWTERLSSSSNNCP